MGSAARTARWSNDGRMALEAGSHDSRSHDDDDMAPRLLVSRSVLKLGEEARGEVVVNEAEDREI